MSKDNTGQPQENNIAQEAQNIPQERFSDVASRSKQSLIIFGLSLVIFCITVYSFLFSGTTTSQNNQNSSSAIISTNTTSSNNEVLSVPQIPVLPVMPKLVTPEIVEPKGQEVAVAPPSVTEPQINLSDDNSTKEQISKKRKSNIILLNSASSSPDPSSVQIAQNEAFKPRSDMRYLLSKGKIIDVILETAINTDHPGEIRGVVSRDVFAEDGTTRLIPKGSKIFGSFTSSLDAMYGIINVDWSRIDLATGYSFMFNAISVDNLGRKGIAGRLDNKYKETISSNLLSSVINIGIAKIQDQLIKPGSNTVQATENTLLSQSLLQLATTTATANPLPILSNAIITTTCTTGLNYFKDTTMPAYKTLSSTCATLTVAPSESGNYNATFQAMLTALQKASIDVTTANVSNSTSNLSTTQQATQTAATSLAQTVQTLLTSQKYTPNVTINQGQLIRVVISKDYVFPSKAIGNLNVIR
jgi:type IV secretion system protein VirB10